MAGSVLCVTCVTEKTNYDENQYHLEQDNFNIFL